MDTLAIVRAIREAESLADAGRHDEARRLLEPMARRDGLTDNQRSLLARKIELFDRRAQRMTRISTRGPDDTSVDTVIREPRPRERPTEKPGEAERGRATEVVPDEDTEVPAAPRPTPAESDRAGAFRRVNDDEDETDDTPASDDSGVTVRDSIVMPRADTDRVMNPPKALTDDQLQALADEFPGGDLRRELALEVLRLRGEIPARGRRDRKQESGSYRIPASEVNTIVRTAAGTDDIEVHLPAREDEAADLQVLRRDSVRGEKVDAPVEDRTSAAQGYIDARKRRRGPLRIVSSILGFAVVIGVVAWATHLVYHSLTAAEEAPAEISGEGVGDYRLGANLGTYPELDGASAADGELSVPGRGWIIQHDEGRISAITVPGPEHSAGADSRFSRMNVVFEGRTLALADGASPEKVIAALGQPTPRFSEELFNTSTRYTLTYVSRQGDRTLEFIYATARPEAPRWIRIRTDDAPASAPDLSRHRGED